METKEIFYNYSKDYSNNDSNNDTEYDEYKDYNDDGEGNISSSKLGYRCIACCEFFNKDDVTRYGGCHHYVCNGCNMPLDTKGNYIGCSDDDCDGNECFMCIANYNYEKSLERI